MEIRFNVYVAGEGDGLWWNGSQDWEITLAKSQECRKRDNKMAYADALIESPEAGLTKESAGEDFYRVGLMYSTGLGVAADYVAAHKWFNLAALKGVKEAREQRREMIDYMSSLELRQAQRAAREWIQKAH